MRAARLFAGGLAIAMLAGILAAPAGAAATRRSSSAPAPRKTARPAPTPTPIPAEMQSPLPYPAYGTPAPGVSQTRVQNGVPPQITLAEAIAIAAAKSPVLASARADYQLAKVPVDSARGALFPSLSGTGTLDRFTGPSLVNGANISGPATRTSISKSAQVALRQLIFDGGRVLAQIRSARASEVSAAGTYQRAVQTLSFNVATQYYNALQAEAATSLAAQVVVENEAQENLVNAQLRAGTASQVDLATAEFPTAQARVALVKAQGAELSAIAQFANTLGLDADVEVRPVDDTPSDPTATLLKGEPLTYPDAIKRALLLRPDFLAAADTLTAAQQNLRAARLGNFPSVNGSASYSTNSTNPVNGGDFRPSNSVGLSLTVPIYDQGLTRAQTAQAQYNMDKAQAQLVDTELTVQLSVRQALVGLISAQSALLETQSEYDKANEVLKATQAQYRAGVTTLPLLLNAQVGLTQAQTDRLNAIYALRQAEQSYVFSLGESDLAS